MIKAVLFDFFDTIAADFYRVWLERNHYSRTGEFLELAKGIDEGNISLEERYSPQGLVRKILQTNRIEKYFDEIIISGEIGFAKPDSEIFRIALKRLNVDAPETVFVDDLETYLEGARQAGITGILFKDTGQLKSDLEKAGVTISPNFRI